jgi:hypothetical protein
VVYRNGVPVAGCDAPGIADPTPCVASRTPTGGGVVITVLTIAASQWNFSGPAPFQVAGFHSPVEMGGQVNEVKAGRTIPVKFSLGGDRGLGVLLAGSPSSVTVACPNDPSPATVDGSSGTDGLSYDPASDQYTWRWRTSSAWRGCRRLDVAFVDGSSLSAVFRFR